MNELLKSKIMIAFFIFVIMIAYIQFTSIQKDSYTIKNEIIQISSINN